MKSGNFCWKELRITDAEGTEKEGDKNTFLDRGSMIGKVVNVHATVHRFTVNGKGKTCI